jgi:membrane peptidoglycan carboxypeptidase
MPAVPLITRRRRRLLRPRRIAGGAAGLGCSLALGLLAAVAALVSSFLYASLTQDLPSLASLPDLLESQGSAFAQPTRLYDRTGSRLLLSLENPGAAGAAYLLYTPGQAGGLSENLVAATLAISDPDFWQHPGFRWSGLWENSAPTLAQRLVSELLLADEPPGWRRSLRERLLAAQITDRFGRAKILEWYLNSANFGRLAFGADAAARVYLGKSASELSLGEAALLAAAAEAPALNPHDAPQAALERQKLALQAMLSGSLIDAQEYLQASQARLSLQPAAPGVTQPAPAFTQLVLEQLIADLGRRRVERGGLQVITSLDLELQTQTACALQAQLARLRVGSIQAAAPDCEAARLLPTLPLSQPAGDLQAVGNAAILDPRSGQLLALVTGQAGALETAYQEGRPPGTLLTPFVALAGFTRGLSPASLVWDIPTASLEAVPSLDGRYDGPLRLRSALANDDLVPAVQVLFQAGAQNVWRIAQQMGLDLEQPSSGAAAETLLWQGGRVRLLPALQAYATLANQGVLAGASRSGLPAANGLAPVEPVLVLQIADRRGEILAAAAAPARRPVISPELAYLLIDSLSDEAIRWRTAGHPNPLEIGRPAGAKLGRTLDGQDGYAFGFTPGLAVGVWIGGQAPAGTPGLYPDAAAAVWHAAIQYASRSQPPQGWSAPPGVSRSEVCDPSGLLPTPNCPNLVAEVFLTGSEPTQADNLFQAFNINRETGRLATANTPQELIEQRVYLVLPPEAAAWAADLGLPRPPETFDVVLAESPVFSGVQITSPAMFAALAGQVQIEGAAAGPGFDYYRLQVGQGLNPQSWVQIGEDQTAPVEAGPLAIWDTRSLNGLYAIQLLVVRQDRRVESAIVQVTIDNQSPSIQVRYPLAGAALIFPATIPFQVEAGDNLGVSAVDFYLDGSLLLRLSEPPFTLPWEARLGEHTLRVVAHDRAGNQSQAQVAFTVQREQ